jgi:hypothetical protein
MYSAERVQELIQSPSKDICLNKQILHNNLHVSSSENIEREVVIVQVNLYKQMREQLLAKLKIYQLQNKVELAKIISESIYDTN